MDGTDERPGENMDFAAGNTAGGAVQGGTYPPEIATIHQFDCCNSINREPSETTSDNPQRAT